MQYVQHQLGGLGVSLPIFPTKMSMDCIFVRCWSNWYTEFTLVSSVSLVGTTMSTVEMKSRTLHRIDSGGQHGSTLWEEMTWSSLCKGLWVRGCDVSKGWGGIFFFDWAWKPCITSDSMQRLMKWWLVRCVCVCVCLCARIYIPIHTEQKTLNIPRRTLHWVAVWKAQRPTNLPGKICPLLLSASSVNGTPRKMPPTGAKVFDYFPPLLRNC